MFSNCIMHAGLMRRAVHIPRGACSRRTPQAQAVSLERIRGSSSSSFENAKADIHKRRKRRPSSSPSLKSIVPPLVAKAKDDVERRRKRPPSGPKTPSARDISPRGSKDPPPDDSSPSILTPRPIKVRKRHSLSFEEIETQFSVKYSWSGGASSIKGNAGESENAEAGQEATVVNDTTGANERPTPYGNKPNDGPDPITDNRAIYVVDKADEEKMFFSGVVRRSDGTYVKLHDPHAGHDISDPLDGHVMDDAERAAEWFHYSGGDEVRDFLPDVREDLPLTDWSKRPRLFVENELTTRDDRRIADVLDWDEMFPFSSRPPEEDEDQPDASDPLDPRAPPLVRALDGVVCMVRDQQRNVRGKHELFWSTAVAVSANGRITAEAKAAVPFLGIEQYDWLSFPVTCVLFSKKGPNWPGHKFVKREVDHLPKTRKGWGKVGKLMGGL
ncbi:hypothetical protein ACHAWF_001820 [Thalassiosira exigua]